MRDVQTGDSPLGMEDGKESRDRRTPEGDRDEPHKLMYGVTDRPDLYWSIVLAMQQALIALCSSMAMPLLIASQICAHKNAALQGELVAATIFMAGISTILMILFGVRLPIVQGPSATFIAATISMMASRKCPVIASTDTTNSLTNWTDGVPINLQNRSLSAAAAFEEETVIRIREISGSLMIASVVQILLGTTGLLGYMMHLIGPLTLAPSISLTAISIVKPLVQFCSPNWYIAIGAAALVLIFASYLGSCLVPCPAYDRKLGFHFVRLPVFKMLPLFLAVMVTWSIAGILTATNVFPPGSPARTDYKIHALKTAPWFKVPYPGMFGAPTVSVGGVAAMLSATLMSIIDSLADYYATAIVAGVHSPPDHAINRGIAVEGLSSVLSGAIGSCHGTTSYSSGISAIIITRIASRHVYLITGIILVVFGVIGKFCALMSSVPLPVIGGIGLVAIGMYFSVALSYLQFVDLKSPRNLMILGVSTIIPMCLSEFASKHPEQISTGVPRLDEIFVTVLSSSMLLSGVIACFLDNTMPGSADERGIKRWRRDTMGSSADRREEEKNNDDSLYQLPLISNIINKVTCLKYVPCCTTFKPEYCRCRKTAKRARHVGSAIEETLEPDAVSLV